MRIMSAVTVVITLVSAGTPAVAQTIEQPRDVWTLDVGTGMSRYGPHVFGGLELSMQRWLALRSEGLFGLQSRENRPGYRLTALSLTGVLSFRGAARISPYLLGGYAVSASQGFGPKVGPLGAAGLRFRVGKLQPFIELRAQHRVGVPISIGLRF
jgi:hypothetical protein